MPFPSIISYQGFQAVADPFSQVVAEHYEVEGAVMPLQLEESVVANVSPELEGTLHWQQTLIDSLVQENARLLQEIHTLSELLRNK